MLPANGLRRRVKTWNNRPKSKPFSMVLFCGVAMFYRGFASRLLHYVSLCSSEETEHPAGCRQFRRKPRRLWPGSRSSLAARGAPFSARRARNGRTSLWALSGVESVGPITLSGQKDGFEVSAPRRSTPRFLRRIVSSTLIAVRSVGSRETHGHDPRDAQSPCRVCSQRRRVRERLGHCRSQPV